MVVGTNQDYLAVLLTIQTKRDETTGKMTSELTDHAKRWFRFARYDVQTVRYGMVSNKMSITTIFEHAFKRYINTVKRGQGV